MFISADSKMRRLPEQACLSPASALVPPARPTRHHSARSPLLPADPLKRAKVRAAAYVIACDVHPVQNLRVMNRLKSQFGADQDQAVEWNRHWIALGFATLEGQAPDQGLFGGASPNLADLCLVPQMANARRFGLDLAPYPRLVRIDAALREIPAFAAAAPEAVKN